MNVIVCLALLRYAAGPMVWLSIILGVTILMTASALFWYRYNINNKTTLNTFLIFQLDS